MVKSLEQQKKFLQSHLKNVEKWKCAVRTDEEDRELEKYDIFLKLSEIDKKLSLKSKIVQGGLELRHPFAHKRRLFPDGFWEMSLDLTDFAKYEPGLTDFVKWPYFKVLQPLL